MRFIHNGVESKKMYFDGQSMWGAEMAEEVESNYYLYCAHSGDESYIRTITSNYISSEKTTLEFTFVPGEGTGNYWVGNLPGYPGAGWPDTNDIRIINYGAFRFDYGGDMQSFSSDVLQPYSHKYHVTMGNHFLTIKDLDTDTVIVNYTGTTVGSFTGEGIKIYPVGGFKLYNVKVIDDVLGTVLDAYVKADGLFDKVSNSYVTVSGWTVGGNYYISPGNGAIYIPLAPTYTVKGTTHLTYTMVPGAATGDCWIGNLGCEPGGQLDDNHDFRIINYRFFASTFDMSDARQDFDYVIDANTPKITVETHNYGVSVWDASGELIYSQEWSNIGTFDTGIPIWIYPINSNFKVYNVKIEDDVQGTILDAYVDANGLFDKVSNSYITTTGWTVGGDE